MPLYVRAKAIELAGRSCELNGLSERIRFIQCDVAKLQMEEPDLRGTADAVVSNPPYIARGAGITNAGDSKYLSRQETTAGIKEFAAAAAFLLKEARVVGVPGNAYGTDETYVRFSFASSMECAA